jgi:hypothetical protein
MTQGLPRTYATARWLDDLDPNGAETASDLESLEQDCLHVLSEVLGSNLADPDGGVGLSEVLSGTTADMLAKVALIDPQLEADPRITSSLSTATQQPDGTWLVSVELVVSGSVVSLPFVLGPGGLSGPQK